MPGRWHIIRSSGKIDNDRAYEAGDCRLETEGRESGRGVRGRCLRSGTRLAFRPEGAKQNSPGQSGAATAAQRRPGSRRRQ